MDAENRSSTPHQPISSTPKKSVRAHAREWLQVILIALVISLPIRFFIAEPFVVNGASMDPTFSTGQFLIVDRLTYRFEQPSRGDVIVFKYPNNPSVYFIKRIIGLPGETLSIKDGIVTVINSENPKGLTLDETYIDQTHRSHETTTTKLGANQYFVMGDNRAQSSDSRVWGALDKGLITGRPIVRLLPVNQLSILPGIHHEYPQTK
ncbi:MAG: signal peptidase I [Patescibacteria group bacterium]